MEDPEAEKLDNVVAIPSQVSTSPAKEAPPGDAETLPPIREGLAEVLPVNAKRKDGKNDVFYNPAQVFNRDLSVLVLSVFGKLREEEAQEKDRRRIERALAKAAAEKPPPPAEAPVETAEIQEQGEEATPKDEQVPRTALPQILEQMTGLKVLEALAATGIRTVRYAKELPVGPGGVKRIVANDLDENAVAHMKRNFAHNDLSGERVQAINSCANAHMYSRRAKGHGGLGQMAYDVIDLDPYGSVSPFVDAAVQAVSDGGLLCITSTDMPVLGGNHPETCFARYGGSALKAGYVHEMALRLVLHSFASAAARCGREVIPLLCASIDFYVRLFVRVYDSPQRAKRHASKTAIVHQCVQCDSFFTQKFGEMEEGKEKFRVAKVTCPGSECPECGGRLKVGGPFHSGPLYDTDFVQRCLQVCAPENMSTLPGVTSWKKITGLLTAMSEENDDALFYKLPNLCKSLKVNQVPLRQFRGTLTSLGYRVSHFHREPQAIKTNAPNQVVFDLLRLWAEEHPPTKCPLPALLEKEISLPRPLEWRTEGHQGEKVAKFLPNPEPNWGPKPRARSGAERPAEETDKNILRKDIQEPQPKRQTLETSAPEGAEPTEPAAKDSAMEAVEEK